jgi:hypothetical protein
VRGPSPRDEFGKNCLLSAGVLRTVRRGPSFSAEEVLFVVVSSCFTSRAEARSPLASWGVLWPLWWGRLMGPRCDPGLS